MGTWADRIVPPMLANEPFPRIESPEAFRASTRIENVIFSTPDGALLHARLFHPEGAPRAAVLVAGGTAIQQRFYQGFAEALARAGYAAMTLDYRGIGASKEAHPDPTMSGWVKDLNAALDLLAARFDLPVYYIGHSFGGQALGLLSEPNRRVAGAVLVAAQSGWVGHWPMPARLWIAAVMYGVMPVTARILGRVPGWMGIGETLPGGAAAEWSSWCRHRGYTTEALPHPRLTYGVLRRPMLALSFTDDPYAPAAAVEALLGFFKNADIEHHAIAPADVGRKALGHFAFFRRSHAAMWEPILTWLAERTGDAEESVPHDIRQTPARDEASLPLAAE